MIRWYSTDGISACTGGGIWNYTGNVICILLWAMIPKKEMLTQGIQ